MKKLMILGGLAALLLGGFFIVPAAIAAGPWSRGGNCPMWGGPGGATAASVSPELQRIATFLGTTPEELRTQLQQGKSLAQIADARKITRQALIDFVLAPIKDILQLRVKYAYLTQAQADEALKARTEWVNTFVDRVNAAPQAAAPGQTGAPGYGPRGGGNGLGLGRMGPGMMGGFGRTW